MKLRGKTGAVLLLVVFGIVKLPIEHALEGKMRENRFREGRLDLEMHEQLGQAAFVASLGGFRSLVASGLYLMAHTAFEQTDWGKVEQLYKMITALQPRNEHYWNNASWHMAYNAHSYYLRKSGELSEWDRILVEKETLPYYLERGRKFLEDGLRYLPEEWRLYREMAELHARKFNDYGKAADWYLEGSKQPYAWSLLYRLYLYNVSRAEGREQEAYDALLEAHRQGAQTPSVVLGLEELEDKFADEVLATKGLEGLQQAALESSGGGHFDLAVLGRYYERIAKDPRKAAVIYEQLAKSPDAPSYYQKKWGLELAKIPGQEKNAADVLQIFLRGRLRGVYERAEKEIKRLEGGGDPGNPEE